MMKRCITQCVLMICAVSLVQAATLPPELAVENARLWMKENPVMSAVAERSATVSIFPDSGDYSVYVVNLAPGGYLVLNSDDRLLPVVAFSPEGQADLTDDPQNTFRELLLCHVEKSAQMLASGVLPKLSRMDDAPTELFGPFLETTWDQTDPYNLLCPPVSGGLSGYDGRAPVGCVPTAYGQILNYHRWPVHGQKEYSYVDNEGSVTGEHSAVFADDFDWGSMLSVYGASNSVASEAAVSELMVELGVIAEEEYEVDGSAASISLVAKRLDDYLYFEPATWHSNRVELLPSLEADLRAGFPCLVSLPNIAHVIVADGLEVLGGTTYYHLNYGWGGSHNSWYNVDSVYDGPFDDGVTGLRPMLMAFPMTNAVTAAAAGETELQWIIPKRLEDEVAALRINRLEKQVGSWSSDGTAIPAYLNEGWSVVTNGYSGDGWYADPMKDAQLVLDDFFVPNAGAELSFHLFFRFVETESFVVSASTNGGYSYDAIFAVENTNLWQQAENWQQEAVSLAPFAGQQISLKFEHVAGTNYYNEGGVRLDDLSVSDAEWYAWKPFREDTTLASRRFSSTSTTIDDCADFSVFEVTSKYQSLFGDWAVTNADGAANCFYKSTYDYAPGNGEEGQNPSDVFYNLTSKSTITPTESSRLTVRTKFKLGSEETFRIMISTNDSDYSTMWVNSANLPDWTVIPIDLSNYAGLSIKIRFEYEAGGNYFPDGGIWIDSIKLEGTVNADLEGQPIYYTMLSDLPAGTHTLAARLFDTNGVEHGVAPSFTLSVAGEVDDGDGMPAAWELEYGLDPETNDGALDPDGDLLSNFDEYVAGTDPTNAVSRWIIQPGDAGLPTFYGAQDRVYTIEYSTNLVTGPWEPLESGVAGSDAL
ncbi:MAG: C10 family peptidase, partial [Pontiellaceae bacterium]|nr:C10 family peptidase [Pontiellaceae bacterium]